MTLEQNSQCFDTIYLHIIFTEILNIFISTIRSV